MYSGVQSRTLLFRQQIDSEWILKGVVTLRILVLLAAVVHCTYFASPSQASLRHFHSLLRCRGSLPSN